ncbi:MAG TPA: hypothetical protein PLZ45_11500 [Ferruginibacter sp.]|nr:hypothetical protein [Chitinophagaceae bacterium]HRI25296.1 hypothetical protein [Ferruginibacter sp.]
MAKQKPIWKKGRGKLGPMDPLLGTWVAQADSPMGKLTCTRILEPVLNGTYLQLSVTWDFGKKAYRELAMIGVRDGRLSFWSFTSDGKHSQGTLADGTDVHPEAVCFEAQMPAGLARMVYWPNEDGGFNWAVESKTKKGWNRFTMHHYKKMKS